MQLMDIAQGYAIKLSRELQDVEYAQLIAKKIREIKEQQSEELKVIE
jgi:hypothetical protein